MKTNLPQEGDEDANLHRAANFKCHGMYVIGFNALLGAAIYHVFRVKPLRSGRGCRAPLDFVMTNCVYYHP